MDVDKKKRKDKDKKKRDTLSVADPPTPASAPDPTTDDDADADSSAPTPAGLSVIAHPLAGRRLSRRLLRLVKKASKVKSLRRGVKEVVKAVRKGEKGLLIIAGNITPIDVITHLPVLCEESGIPYVYVAAKEELGSAGSTKRPTSCVLVQAAKGVEHEEYFEEVRAEVLKVNPLIA